MTDQEVWIKNGLMEIFELEQNLRQSDYTVKEISDVGRERDQLQNPARAGFFGIHVLFVLIILGL